MITQGYHHDNPPDTQEYHHNNTEVITTITKDYHHDNPINKHKDNNALIVRARAEGLDDFLALYPPEKKDSNSAEELAPIFLDCLKETTKHGLLRALEAQKKDRQWTESNGRYISTPLNWLSRKAFRKFLPDTEAEVRAAHRQAEETMLDSLNRLAEEDAGDDYARIQAINEDNTISAFHARRRLAALKIAVDRRAPDRILRRLASEAAIGLQIIDTDSAKLPDTITVSSAPVAISEIRSLVSSILPRKAAQ